MKRLAVLLLIPILASGAWARGSKSGSSHSGHAGSHKKSATKSHPKHHPSTYSQTAPRDSHGRIQRSEAAKHEFMKQTGYPHGRAGYVVDHIVPLAKGGKDHPRNMQWQTIEAAKAKDKVERK